MSDVDLKEAELAAMGARYLPVLLGQVRRQRVRIEDLEREVRLLRQHTAGCERCAAVQEEDAAKRRADV